MYRQFLEGAGALPMTLFALALFVAAFSFLVARALRKRNDEVDALAALPLKEDNDVC